MSVNGVFKLKPIYSYNYDLLYAYYVELSECERKKSVKVFCDGGSFRYFDYFCPRRHAVFLHRLDGHACEDFSGRITWFIKGTIYHDTKMYCEDANMDGEQSLYMYLRYGDTLPDRVENL